MSEGYLQSKIMAYLLKHGAYAVNIHCDEWQSSVPDILVCYKGRFIGLELKDANGRLSPGQRKHLNRIQKSGGIGEGVRSIERAKEILDSIDSGEIWRNSDY